MHSSVDLQGVLLGWHMSANVLDRISQDEDDDDDDDHSPQI